MYLHRNTNKLHSMCIVYLYYIKTNCWDVRSHSQINVVIFLKYYSFLLIMPHIALFLFPFLAFWIMSQQIGLVSTILWDSFHFISLWPLQLIILIWPKTGHTLTALSDTLPRNTHTHKQIHTIVNAPRVNEWKGQRRQRMRERDWVWHWSL